MFRFDNILEQWASQYKPLSHQPRVHEGRRTFYRIDTINGNNEFVQNYNMAPSPCMAYSALIDASLNRANNKTISYRHSIYFMVKQCPPANNNKSVLNDEIEAKYDADELVQDLLAFLFALKSAAVAMNAGSTVPSTLAGQMAATLPADERKAVVGLQLDAAEWGTLPMRYNGWWICGLEIEQVVPRNLCVVTERYHPSE